jgi:hypothetical protein
MKRFLFVVLVVAAMSVGACNKASVPAGSEGNTAATGGMLQNPIKFPLYEGSSVISSGPFSQTVTAGQAGSGALAAGAGTYRGNEVVAGSNASFSDLENWLRQIEKQPPSGYTAVVIPSSMSTVHAVAIKNHIDFALFRDANNPKHGVVVIAMDPNVANQKLGPIVGLVSKYQTLPAMMRQPIDTQLKQRFGYTASEFVAPGSPLGTALGALSEFRGKDERALVVVEASKQ